MRGCYTRKMKQLEETAHKELFIKYIKEESQKEDQKAGVPVSQQPQEHQNQIQNANKQNEQQGGENKTPDLSQLRKMYPILMSDLISINNIRPWCCGCTSAPQVRW